MKIIDLLNKIANGEEVPKKIEYRNKIFVYDKDNQCYIVENYNEYNDLLMELSNHKGTDLLYEVEIIEEEKKIPEKIEKITISEDEKSLFFDDKYQDISLHNISPIEVAFAIKINEIIDKINGDDK